MLILNCDHEYLITVTHDGLVGHCHWCVVEIVSTIVWKWILALW